MDPIKMDFKRSAEDVYCVIVARVTAVVDYLECDNEHVNLIQGGELPGIS
jgi:hypothetical protein